MADSSFNIKEWAGVSKDLLTSVGILVGGWWALWRFGYSDWLRRRAEISSLEGNSIDPEIYKFTESSVVVYLRWTWRNVGTRPVYIDDDRTIITIYEIAGEINTFVDPRQYKDRLTPIGEHYPLKGFGFYMLEPAATSGLVAVPILALSKPFIARAKIVADIKKHPTGGSWSYSWERWQVFRTDLPKPGDFRTLNEGPSQSLDISSRLSAARRNRRSRQPQKSGHIDRLRND
jgi:hypothetical protein